MARTLPAVWAGPLLDPSGYSDEVRGFLLSLDRCGWEVAARQIGHMQEDDGILPAHVEIARRAARRPAPAIGRDGRRGIRGRWDALRVEQVATNLLSNAIKYGAGRPITVTTGADADRAWISVEDQGIGIAPEALARIFDRFERGVSSHDYAGLGLGLWISRQIAERLGGDITARSEPGKGSTFTVFLPIAGPAAPSGRSP